MITAPGHLRARGAYGLGCMGASQAAGAPMRACCASLSQRPHGRESARHALNVHIRSYNDVSCTLCSAPAAPSRVQLCNWEPVAPQPPCLGAACGHLERLQEPGAFHSPHHSSSLFICYSYAARRWPPPRFPAALGHRNLHTSPQIEHQRRPGWQPHRSPCACATVGAIRIP